MMKYINKKMLAVALLTASIGAFAQNAVNPGLQVAMNDPVTIPGAVPKVPATATKVLSDTRVTPFGAQFVRVKDVARLKGYESYELVGYGIVVGLNDTGDSDKTLTQQTIANMMQNFNIVVNPGDLTAKNAAAVIVTVTIRGNRRKGDMISASISAIGDCDALSGGQLVMTPLLGADGEVWALAQGPVTTGGYSFGSSGDGGDKVTKNHPTAGMLTNGVKLLRDFGPDYRSDDMITYILNDPDFTSAVNLAKSINDKYFGVAVVKDASSVQVRIPNNYKDENIVAQFISEVGQLYFATDSVAKVVFNERTGTIVIGHNVRISNAAVSHGNLYVRVQNEQGVSQPGAFAGGNTQVINQQTTSAKEEPASLFELENTTTVSELVSALNSLGVTSRDIMIIFHVLKQAGALHAELEAI